MSTQPRSDTGARGAALGRLERLPLRRIVLALLALGIGTFVVLGTYATLTLPGDEYLEWSFWANLIVIGVALGAVYALIALGYTLVYGILRMINFAHGEIFMIGAFGSYFFASAYSRSGFLDRHPIPALMILFIAAIVVSTVVAMLLERIAYRPLRGATRLVPLITAIGATLFLQNSAKGFFGSQTRGYPRPEILSGSLHIGSVPIDKVEVLVLCTTAVAVGALQVFVRRSKTGRAMRAVAEDKEIASLMGIDVDRVIVITFAVGGMLAGVAGVLFSLAFGQVGPFMGFLPGIAAFTAAVLGGIGSIPGAALGGLSLGVAQQVLPYLLLAGWHVPSPFQLKDVVTFSVLVLVLLFRPGGLLGTGEAEKV